MSTASVQAQQVHPTWVGDYGQMHFGVSQEEGVTALVYVLYPDGLHELSRDGRHWSSIFYYPLNADDLAVMSQPWDSTDICHEVQSRIDAAWAEWKNEARKSLIEALG